MTDIIADVAAAADPEKVRAATAKLGGSGADPDPFQAALSDFDAHFGGLKQKYGGQEVAAAPAPASPPMPPASPAPAVSPLAMLAAVPQQAPQPTMPTGGNVLSAIANPVAPQSPVQSYLSAMMHGRNQSNALAALLQQQQPQGATQ